MDRLKALKERRNELEKASESIRSFIKTILDDMSFVEMDTFVHQSHKEGEAFGEGVVSGFGRINDNEVCIFAQNIDVLKGGVGKLHAEKIVKCMLKASNANVPLISIIDSMGARMDEGTDVLESYGEILGAAARLDVPHILIIKSASYGMISTLCGIADFVFMMDNAVMTSTSPKILAASAGKQMTASEVGGAKINAELSGQVDFVGNAAKIAEEVKKLVTYIYNDAPSLDDVNRASAALNQNPDIHTVISEVFDKDSFIELGQNYASEAICGLALLDGVTVGVVANNNNESNYITQNALKKIAKYVSVFDGLNIPVINLVDTLGLNADLKSEHNGILTDAANVISRYANFEGVLISVIIGHACGFGYTAFASNGIGYDYTLAWANADISSLPSSSLAALEKREELGKANLAKLNDNNSQEFDKLIKDYSDQNTDVFFAARKGYIDDIIEPALTRNYLIAALGMIERS